MASFILAEHWLSRIWCLGTIPWCHICLRIVVGAAISKPSIWFLRGSIQDELLSTWWMTMMDLLPPLEMKGKSPVWSM